ncbi:amidase signature enzyme [Mollisia scopiformis]|uniref:Amidase signature enzyme n=1 Tax=Mollisia scopiformis TaxID=149040 RepID=A0A132B8U2_MOLSC|nr:amidase signature enzyme [Mollisia scopiformis]KUJ08791.1 amidase signature enzyme [Mollisia scopiformis]
MTLRVNDGFRILPQSGHTLCLGDRRYPVRSTPEASLLRDASFQAYNGPALATVFVHDEDKRIITEQWIKRQITDYQIADDVFHNAFLAGIIVVGDSELDAGAQAFLKGAGMQWLHVMASSTTGYKLQPGPYALLDDHLRNVYRAYRDTSGAFFCTLERSGDGRPFHEIYPAKQETAPCIQRLVDLGALLVAKTKLTSFATWEEPVESIDWPAPWNPRADGFLSAGGSSNGSGAAISTYDWLDIAIGSDTTGSVMRPALWNGCFAMRPSHGVLSTEGFFSCIKYQWQTPSAVWTDTEQQCDLALKFVHDMEFHLNLKHKQVSFKGKWELEPPIEAEGKSLDAYMLDATEDMWYDDYHAFDDFRERYYSKYQKPPYVSPPTHKAWESCKPITKSQRDEAVRRLGIFRTWFRKSIINAEYDNAMVVLPIENVYPRYRDEPHNFQRPPVGVHNVLLASLNGAPELVVPVGHVPYYSKITQREEQLPYVVGLMTLPVKGRILKKAQFLVGIVLLLARIDF